MESMEKEVSSNSEPTEPGLNRYELRWNDHIPYFTSVFRNLSHLNELTDVTFACEDGIVCAHKLVLSSCSDYLRVLFMRLGTPHPVIFLKNNHVSLVRNLLEFVYCGSVSVSKDELALVLNLGHSLQIQGLSKFKLSTQCEPQADEIVAGLEREMEILEEQLESEKQSLPGDVTNVEEHRLHHEKEMELISENRDDVGKGKKSLSIENKILRKDMKEKEAMKKINRFKLPHMHDDQNKDKEIMKETLKQKPKIKSSHIQNLKNTKVQNNCPETSVNFSKDEENNHLYPQRFVSKNRGVFYRYHPILKKKIGKYYVDHGFQEVSKYCKNKFGYEVPRISLMRMKADYLKDKSIAKGLMKETLKQKAILKKPNIQNLQNAEIVEKSLSTSFVNSSKDVDNSLFYPQKCVSQKNKRIYYRYHPVLKKKIGKYYVDHGFEEVTKYCKNMFGLEIPRISLMRMKATYLKDKRISDRYMLKDIRKRKSNLKKPNIQNLQNAEVQNISSSTFVNSSKDEILQNAIIQKESPCTSALMSLTVSAETLSRDQNLQNAGDKKISPTASAESLSKDLNSQNTELEKVCPSTSAINSSKDKADSLLYPQKCVTQNNKRVYYRYHPVLKKKIGKYYVDHGFEEVTKYCKNMFGLEIPRISLMMMKAAYLKDKTIADRYKMQDRMKRKPKLKKTHIQNLQNIELHNTSSNSIAISYKDQNLQNDEIHKNCLNTSAIISSKNQNKEIEKNIPNTLIVNSTNDQSSENSELQKNIPNTSAVHSSEDIENTLLYPQKCATKSNRIYYKYHPVLKKKIGKYYNDHGLKEAVKYCKSLFGLDIPKISLEMMKAAYLKDKSIAD